MNLKRTLIETLPPGLKRRLAVPYDLYQTRKADHAFKQKSLPEYEAGDDAPDHIVCVVVDALRADHVDAGTTPYLASLDGCDAITPGAWTFPAMSSLVSGVYPHEHGAMKRTDEPDDSERLTLPPRMDDGRETITESLAGAGYDTYGGFGHDTPFVALSGRFGKHALSHSITSNAEDVLADYLEWVDGRDCTFSLLQLADPHVPVDPPGEYWEKYDVDESLDDIENWRYNATLECGAECERYREHRRRLYRASVDYVDDAIAGFVDSLESLVEDPLVVITADHGEMHWEHVQFDVSHFGGTGCVGHGGTPYEHLARVPLLTNGDWSFEGHVSLIDIPPTLADCVGINPSEMTGRSLLEDGSGDRLALVEGSLSGYEKKAIYSGQHKLIVSRGDGTEVGYVLPEEERTDLPDDVKQHLLDALPPWPDGDEVQTEVASVVEDRLDKLGYR
ncbi:MAG: sulfatase-like hydrolase/transferase [Halovenus sp.]